MALDVGPEDTEVMGNLGGYDLLEEIGRGGMGAVWRARQPGLGRVVAVKILPGGEWAGAAAKVRFRREAEAAASLRHPHIVAVHDCGEHEGTLWYSMDLIEGETLDVRLRRDGRMDARAAAAMLEKAARAVHQAHVQGIWHRDLKPANILVDAAGEPHIADFGLARTEASTGLTISAHVAGSPHYMPPERISSAGGWQGAAVSGQDRKNGKDRSDGKNENCAGPDSQSSQSRAFSSPEASGDIYSLGATLYHMLTGGPPFRGADVAAVLAKVIAEAPARLSSLVADLPRDLENICLRCVEKSPASRYASAADLAEDLRRFLNGEPVRARPVSAAARLWRWAKRKPALAALSGALLLAAAALITVLAVSARRATTHAGELRAALISAKQAQGTAEAATLEARRDTLIAESARARKGWLFKSWGESMGLLAEALNLHRTSRSADPAAARRLRNEFAAALSMPKTDISEAAPTPGNVPHSNYYWADHERRWFMLGGQQSVPYRLMAADGSRFVNLPVRQTSFSTLSAPGGRYLQTQYWAPPAPDSDIWDLSGGTAVARTIKGNLVCWSRDGKNAVRWEGRHWSIYSMKDGTDRPGGEVDYIHAAAWRPDGRAIAMCRTVAGVMEIVLIETTALSILWQDKVLTPSVVLTWSDNGSQVASMDGGGRIHSRCADRGIPGRTMLEPGGPPWESPATGIQFAPGGLLVSHAKSGTCTLWDTASGTLLRSELMAISPAMSAGRRADGALGPLKGRNDTPRWLKVTNGIWRHAAVSSNPSAGPLHALHWSQDSQHLAACGAGVCLWNPASGALSGDIFYGALFGTGEIFLSTCAVPLENGGLLAEYENGLWRSNLLDTYGRTLGLCLRPHASASPGILTRAAQSGHIAAATQKSDRSLVEIFHPDTPADVRTVHLPGAATALALSPDGTLLAAAYAHAEHQFQIYHTADGSLRFTQHNMGIPPRALQFSGDGRQLAFNSCNAHILDTATHQTLGDFSTWSRVDSLAATPAVTMDQVGKWFAVTDPPRRIILYRPTPVSAENPAGWSQFITLESPSGMGLTRLSLSPDGNHLAAATTGPSFEMWDLAALERELRERDLW